MFYRLMINKTFHGYGQLYNINNRKNRKLQNLSFLEILGKAKTSVYFVLTFASSNVINDTVS